MTNKPSFSENYRKRQEDLRQKAFGDKGQKSVVEENVKAFWAVPIATALLIGSVIYANVQGVSIAESKEAIARYEGDIDELKEQIEEQQSRVNASEKEVKKVVDAVVYDAREAGERLVAAEQVMARYTDYGAEEAPSDKEVEDARNTIKTFIDDDYYSKYTFMRKHDWQLAFRSVADYEAADIPVIFTITYKDNLMGTVTGMYSVKDKVIRKLDVRYTVESEKSENRGISGGS